MEKKEIVAMLLAGGRGSRLKGLTEGIAKPAVCFGGKYRLIDFVLSNCTNSGLDTVGVLTQYEPFVLNTYIGNGSPWDLDAIDGGVFLLPPYIDEGGKNWYTGTASAIYSNIAFLDEFDPEHVLILSGDHIYKMDYSKMFEFHKNKNADVTISVMPVPWEETGRFGIMNTDENDKIIDFKEKPDNAVSNLASMGIYIFKWSVLRKALIKDNKNEDSQNDFGNNIIPMLMENKDFYAYSFTGYWKDVGTVSSYWEGNMDLLSGNSELNLDDPEWHIFSRNPGLPVHFIAPEAEVTNTMVNEGCMVYGKVLDSVLNYNVTVGKNSLIKDSVVLPGVKIGENVKINKTIIGEDTVIGDNVTIGENEDEVTLIGNNKRIKKDVRKGVE